MAEKPQVLLAGESWVSLGAHVKGFNDFPTAFYEEGHKALAAALAPRFELVHMPGHLVGTDFPDTVEGLARYAAILFSDIGSDTLLLHPDTFLRSVPRPNRLALLRSYVEQGGGFGMIGGYMSFAGFAARARYHRTPVEAVLPVDIFPYDDRVEVPEGFSPEAAALDHSILAAAAGPWPRLLGYNRTTPKRDAQVLLAYGGDPILAVRQAGAGRTLAFASDCAPHWGSPEFLAWEGYAPFWQAAIGWLSGQ